MEREKRITLTKTELNAFRRFLQNRQIELGSGNRDRDALAIEMSADALDRIQQASDRDYAISNLERNSNRLHDVRTALRRIDAGTFGICVGCGENINPKRLAAVPWAHSVLSAKRLPITSRKRPRARSAPRSSWWPEKRSGVVLLARGRISETMRAQ